LDDLEGFSGPLPRLVAIDECARNARHIEEDAALDKRVYARVAEQDQRRTIIITARIARDLPSLREQFGRSLAVSPLPPSWMPPASLPSRGLNACETLKPLVAFFNSQRPQCIVCVEVEVKWSAQIRSRVWR
jgi:hypothetical protein